MSRYQIITFGCQMNIADSEIIAGELESRGFIKSDNINSADIIVINTCAIRDTAEQKIMAKIGSLKSWKKSDKNRILAIGGCMTAQPEVVEDITKKFPYVDIIFSTENQSNFTDLLNKFLVTKKRQIQIKPEEKRYDISPKRERTINAWVTIMHGCNNFCTYCIVPYVRGREQSIDNEKIINEVKQLIKEGYKQITLLGQNVNSYGNDNPEKFGTFTELLKKLDCIDGDYRIRFMTSHPKDLTEELIKTIANSKHICHSLHLPMQSGSSRILKLMNRKYTSEEYLKKVNMCRKIMPDIELTSDCIVGFPTETEQDFNETLKLVEEVKFMNLYMFVYSIRKGTIAAQMPQVEDCVKKDRIKKLISLQNKISTQKAKKYVGKTKIILIEDYNPKTNEYIGTTDTGKAVIVTSLDDIMGQYKEVTIEKAVGSKLYGKIKGEM